MLTQDHAGAAEMGRMLRQLRRERGLTQVHLARRAEMHPNYLGAIERGEVPNPGIVTVARLGRSLATNGEPGSALVLALVQSFDGAGHSTGA